jgi:hypothetical protein
LRTPRREDETTSQVVLSGPPEKPSTDPATQFLARENPAVARDSPPAQAASVAETAAPPLAAAPAGALRSRESRRTRPATRSKARIRDPWPDRLPKAVAGTAAAHRVRAAAAARRFFRAVRPHLKAPTDRIRSAPIRPAGRRIRFPARPVPYRLWGRSKGGLGI